MKTIKLKNLVEEDFVNYKKISMFLGTSICDWKCCLDGNFDKSICQNHALGESSAREFDIEFLYNRYKGNNLSESIVFGGLEPFLQFEELLSFIQYFRDRNCLDDIVIYTGYYKEEIEDKIQKLQEYPNIIIKYGRFIPNQESHFDEILGVKLASENQYAEKIS